MAVEIIKEDLEAYRQLNKRDCILEREGDKDRTDRTNELNKARWKFSDEKGMEECADEVEKINQKFDERSDIQRKEVDCIHKKQKEIEDRYKDIMEGVYFNMPYDGGSDFEDFLIVMVRTLERGDTNGKERD